MKVRVVFEIPNYVKYQGVTVEVDKEHLASVGANFTAMPLMRKGRQIGTVVRTEQDYDRNVLTVVAEMEAEPIE